ncbi:MAG TPA: Crp/Fnr family transcriptional regulator [Burkholderiales bacterium]
MANTSRPDVLTEAELRALSDQGAVKSFPKHAVIVSEGDETDSLFVILSGRIKVFLADEGGREIVLGTQGPGEYFGEMVLDGGTRSASVMTLEPSRFAVVPRLKVRQFLRDHPEFSVRLVEKLIRRTRALTESVKNLALMDVYGRVARLLLDLAEEDDSGTLVIRERLTQADVASRVGASREMVSKILKDLAVGGYISVKQKHITVHKAPPRHW